MHLHAAIDSLMDDGAELLHTIEATEHEHTTIQSGSQRRRRSRKRS
jgi:hypothetical protein